MPPSARPAAGSFVGEGAGDGPDGGATTAPLVARLEAAEEAGDVDARQLADLIGVTAGGLRAALERPAALTAEQAAAVARALGVDAATMRALRRAAPPAAGAAEGRSAEPPNEGPFGGGPDGRAPAAAGPPAGRAPTLGAPNAAPRAAPPRSTPALLEAVLRAVRGDAAGLALRAAVLDVAAEAARAAGRPLPPGAHALRACLAAPEAGVDGPPRKPPAGSSRETPNAWPGGTPEAEAAGAPDPAALAADAAALVHELQRTAPGYDGLFAPLHDDALADLLARHALAVHPAPGVPAGTRFVLTPPLFGRRRLVLSAAATVDQRRFTLRAALAACAAGHAADDAPLASPAPGAVERVIDVVALADLVPFWQVADARRRGRLGWRALAAHAAELAGAMAADWEVARCADRGALRVALFRVHHL